MTILVLSADDEAAGALTRALERAGMVAQRESSLSGAWLSAERSSPLVIVADTAVDGYEKLLAEARRARPWTRLHLIADALVEPVDRTLPAAFKPFDAAELAALLAREQELAEFDRGRRQLARELEHSERLAAIGRLSASMAHEINNPLAVIFACGAYVSEVAERAGDLELAEVARDIELAAQRIGSFVEHVGGYGRRARTELSDAPITTAIDMALRMLRPRVKSRGVELCVESSPKLYTVHDPARLSQAILNVLSNAVDAASQGGRHVHVSVVSDQDWIVIRVDDDGPGISAEISESVFEPFITTKPHGQGTGLGLAITGQIMDDHFGSASLQNRPEGGARAELRLPRLDPGQHGVLVVASDSSLQRAVEVDLRRAQFEVVTVDGLPQARAALDSRDISVVVCDAPFCEPLRAAARHSKLVCLSGDASGSIPADRLLPKPWQRERLVSAVRELCAQARRRESSAAPEPRT